MKKETILDIVLAALENNNWDAKADNARKLIEAAPELLECTRKLLMVCDDRLSMDIDKDTRNHYKLLKKDAQQAINKAKGNQ